MANQGFGEKISTHIKNVPFFANPAAAAKMSHDQLAGSVWSELNVLAGYIAAMGYQVDALTEVANFG
jgi:tellurite resistance-related uncharacterized protein